MSGSLGQHGINLGQSVTLHLSIENIAKMALKIYIGIFYQYRNFLHYEVYILIRKH